MVQKTKKNAGAKKKVVKKTAKKATTKKKVGRKITSRKATTKKKVTSKKTARKVVTKKKAGHKKTATKKSTNKKKATKKLSTASTKKKSMPRKVTKTKVSSKSTNKKKAVVSKKPKISSSKARSSQAKNTKASVARPKRKKRDTSRVPIVAIGASAGGLDPFEIFFDATAPNTGVAYVVIQHLSPDFQSMMGELLSRHSSMSIKPVTDGLELLPDTIYLNPPRTEMTLENGRFKLVPVENPTQLSLPIDTFFYSLAENYGSDSIAIILSGTGSDGTRGSAVIHDIGGTVLIQDPNSAKFDGMPLSVANAGYADAIGLPSELPGMINIILAGGELESLTMPVEDGDPHASIYALLLKRFGTDFHSYKVATIHRRLERRANMLNLTIYQYAVRVHEDPDELEQIYADLLIDVTAFFRDDQAFDALRKLAVPDIAKDMASGKTIRVWVPGCASGEEAYSLAICFAEYARKQKIELNLKILATDIHMRSIASASAGFYPTSLFTNVDKNLLERYFDKDGEFYQVKQLVRRLVVFSQHNVLKDPPFTRMDLVSCRNMLIYMNESAQQKIMARFHFSLVAKGFLFLGSSETLGKLEDEFNKISQKWRIYQKARDVRLLEPSVLLQQDPASHQRIERESSAAINLSSMAAQQNSVLPMRRAYNSAIDSLLKRYAPSGFLLTKSGEVSHVFGDAGDKLKVADGVFSTKIVDIVNEELKIPISTGLERMRTSSELDFERRVLSTRNGTSTSITIKISPLRDNDLKVNYYLLTIDDAVLEKPSIVEGKDNSKVAATLGDVETVSILRQRIDDLERDLQATEQSLQSTIEELETSNEELQATNEELMASNEELQSTNEELHSVNEELYTVSAEHQSKIDELTIVTDDMDHLLRATSIGIIFLDTDLKMRRFTPSASSAFNIMPQDIGRPFKHVTYEFEGVDLNSIVKRVRDTGEIYEQEVDVNDTPYMLRLLPYAASLNEDVGVVITLIDISELKTVQFEQILAAKQHHQIVSDLQEYIVRWSRDTKELTFCNLAYANLVQEPLDSLMGRDVIDVYTKVIARDNLTAEGSGPAMKRISTEGAGENVEFIELGNDQNGYLIARDWRLTTVYNEASEKIEVLGIGADRSEQYRYNKALEDLASINGGDTTDIYEILGQILDISCAYLSMEVGSIGEFNQKNFVLRAYKGENNSKNKIAVGKAVPLKSDQPLTSTNMFPLALAQLPPSMGEVLAIPQMADSDMKIHPFYEATKLEAYLGTRSVNQSGIDLSIAFSNAKHRQQDYSDYERTFLKIIWKFSCLWIERQRHIQDMQQQQIELETVNENLSRFSYIASHDLQEPLRKIRQFGEMLKEDYGDKLDGDGEYFIDVMTSGATRMSTLVRDLLNYSKTSNNELKPEQVSLNDILDEVKKDLSSAIEQTGAKIKMVDLPEVIADKTMAGQLFHNLISNSIKYTKEGVKPQIMVSAYELSKSLEIDVEDNGIGINNPGDQDIFEAFTRLHSRDEIEGSGIGLATCKAVCERHGWKIGYDSSKRAGAKFTISIPNVAI